LAAAGQQCRGRCVKQSVCTEACTGLSGPMQARAGQRRTERGGGAVSERRAEMPGPAGRRPRDRALRCGCVSDPTPGGMAIASGVRALAGMGKTRGILPISTSLPAVILAASGWPGARALISGVAPARCREALRSLGRHGVRCLPEAGALVWGLSGQGMAQAGTPALCQPSEGRATDTTEYGGCLRVRSGGWCRWFPGGGFAEDERFAWRCERDAPSADLQRLGDRSGETSFRCCQPTRGELPGCSWSRRLADPECRPGVSGRRLSLLDEVWRYRPRIRGSSASRKPSPR